MTIEEMIMHKVCDIIDILLPGSVDVPTETFKELEKCFMDLYTTGYHEGWCDAFDDDGREDY